MKFLDQWKELVYETDLDAVRSEWSKKFQDTYVRVNGEAVLAGATDGKYFYFTTEQGLQLRLVFETDVKIDATFPEVGWFDYRASAIFFQRAPKKQYQKGLNGRNGEFMSVLGGERHPLSKLPFGFSLVSAAYGKPKLKVAAVIENVFSGKIKGASFSRNWALFNHPVTKETAILFYKLFPVAEVTKNGKCKPIVPSFVQEISDFNRDFNVGMEIS